MSGANTNLTPYAGLNESGSVLIVKVQSETIVWSGNPNGFLAGQSGSAFLPPDRVWDYTNKREYLCTTGGTAISTIWSPVQLGVSSDFNSLNITGTLDVTGTFIAQDATETNYLSSDPIEPTSILSGNQAMTVSNLSMNAGGGSGTLSDVAFVMDTGGTPGYDAYTTQIIQTFSGKANGQTIGGLLMQAARQTAPVGSNPEMFAGEAHFVDQTTKASSKTASSIGFKTVFEANDADDGANRRGLQLHLQRTGESGVDVAMDVGFLFDGEAGHHTYKDVTRFDSPFSKSCMNTQNGTEATNANAIWLKGGHHIGFDNANGGLAVSRLSGDDVTLVCSSPIRPANYAAASLPTTTLSHLGAIAYCTNGRNNGEGGGSGTGCLVFVKSVAGTPTWCAIWSGVAVTI